MAKLLLEHMDFTLEIRGEKVAQNYANAQKALGDQALYAFYNFSEPCSTKVSLDGMGASELAFDVEASTSQGIKGKPFFFDWTDYSITVEFKQESRPIGERDAWICTRQMSVRRNSDYHPRGGFLTCFINYQNDIGNSDLTVEYIVRGEKRSFTFGFQVLSSKLDYHSHWQKIVYDIEDEYRLLAFDYLKQTYHSFTQVANGETPDLIWWSLFKAKHEEFLNACRLILNRPHRGARTTVDYLRSDQLKMLTPQQENQLSEHRLEANFKYRNEQYTLSNDTLENRFLKHAIVTIAGTFQRLSIVILGRLQGKDGLSQHACEEICKQRQKLNKLAKHPFFRTVGKFSGMNQESLILQRASGYSTVARIYILLKASYSLQNGIFTLETKNIADLYEIWCFIEVRNIVRELFGKTDSNLEIEDLNRQELNGKFSRSLVKGGNSRILFKRDGVELAELYYNSKTDSLDADGIPASVAPSGVAQKPDIVLQLTRQFLGAPMRLTYLFDAKYRLKSDGQDTGFDQPPDDAINQMHRYRDAIYYRENQGAPLRKEVIGGYILYPGQGRNASLETQHFYKSIQDINIGAFPLRPYDNENRQYLVDFIKKLTQENAQEHIGKSIPQKGMTKQLDLPGTMRALTVFGTTHGQDQLDQIEHHRLYVLPVKVAEQQDINIYNAKDKKWLFIEMRPDNASSYSKIFEVLDFEGFLTIADLQAIGYNSAFRHGADGYYVWRVK